MRRISFAAPAMLFAGFMLYGCHWAQSTTATVEPAPPVVSMVAMNQQAPDLDGEDTTGQRLHLADYRGRVVVLNFWANW